MMALTSTFAMCQRRKLRLFGLIRNRMIAFVASLQLIRPRRFVDDRGWFSEVYSQTALARLGILDVFVQDNHSFSKPAGTIRGLHFQAPPFAQAKLVRCIRGCIYDVVVDLRASSPTFGKWTGAELSAENGRQLYIPVGFAHGFATLEQDCEIGYKVTQSYCPGADGGIRWDDADLAVDWHLPFGLTPTLSQKDQDLPSLAGFESPFSYDGVPLAALLR